MFLNFYKMKKKIPTLGLLLPSGFISTTNWHLCLKFFEEEKLTIYYSPLATQKYFFFAGTIAQRIKQLQQTVEHTKCLLAVRGGSGSIHLLDFLQKYWSEKTAFSLIGFSDISILLNFIATRFQKITIHSYVANTLRLASKADQEFFFRRFQGDWRGELAGKDAKNLRWFGDKANEARLLGGNLTSIVSLLGTPYQISLDNSILFVEDVAEPYYRIERLFSQLYYSGCLKKILGLVLGHFIFANKLLDESKILELIKAFLPVKIPIVANFPAGHGAKNAPLPIGAKVVLDAKKKNFLVAKEKLSLIF